MFYLILFNEVITIYFIINNWLLFISWADNDDMKEQVRTVLSQQHSLNDTTVKTDRRYIHTDKNDCDF